MRVLCYIYWYMQLLALATTRRPRVEMGMGMGIKWEGAQTHSHTHKPFSVHVLPFFLPLNVHVPLFPQKEKKKKQRENSNQLMKTNGLVVSLNTLRQPVFPTKPCWLPKNQRKKLFFSTSNNSSFQENRTLVEKKKKVSSSKGGKLTPSQKQKKLRESFTIFFSLTSTQSEYKNSLVEKGGTLSSLFLHTRCIVWGKRRTGVFTLVLPSFLQTIFSTLSIPWVYHYCPKPNLTLHYFHCCQTKVPGTTDLRCYTVSQFFR